MILSEILESAIGSGDDVGSLNLKHLKSVITSIVEKLEIGDSEPSPSSLSFGDDPQTQDSQTGSSNGSPSDDKVKELEEKLKNLGNSRKSDLFERKSRDRK